MMQKGMLIIVSVLMAAMHTLVLAEPTEITVYKSPTCGCCKKWISHLEQNGFQVEAKDLPNVQPIKNQNGVPTRLRSCHTALVDGYVIEGHVPAKDIKQLLKDRPNVQGLSVPGMPVGSPGMEQGNHKDHYPVVAFDKQGNMAIYNRY